MRIITPSLVVLLILVAVGFTGAAGQNLVQSSGVEVDVRGVTPNDLKPPECAALNINRIREIVDENLNDTGQGTLLLGSPANDTINARNGRDCVLGGGGNDTLDGGGKDDVLIGGPGNDTLEGGQGDDTLYGGPGDDFLDGGPGNNDICYGGGGNDTFERCEVIY